MYAAQPLLSDPFYTAGPAHDLGISTERFTGMELIVDPDLRQPCAIDSDERAIWMRPGLSFSDYHYFLGQALVFYRWGAGWTDRAPRPRGRHDRTVSSDALIIPFRRRPDANGQPGR